MAKNSWKHKCFNSITFIDVTKVTKFELWKAQIANLRKHPIWTSSHLFGVHVLSSYYTIWHPKFWVYLSVPAPALYLGKTKNTAAEGREVSLYSLLQRVQTLHKMSHVQLSVMFPSCTCNTSGLNSYSSWVLYSKPELSLAFPTERLLTLQSTCCTYITSPGGLGSM